MLILHPMNSLLPSFSSLKYLQIPKNALVNVIIKILDSGLPPFVVNLGVISICFWHCGYS